MQADISACSRKHREGAARCRRPFPLFKVLNCFLIFLLCSSLHYARKDRHAADCQQCGKSAVACRRIIRLHAGCGRKPASTFQGRRSETGTTQAGRPEAGAAKTGSSQCGASCQAASAGQSASAIISIISVVIIVVIVSIVLKVRIVR